MLSSVWQSSSDALHINDFGTRLVLSGQRVSQKNGDETHYLGRAEDFLAVFQNMSSKNTLGDMLLRAETYEVNSGHKKIVSFLKNLSSHEFSAVWGFFVLHPMMHHEMRWNFLLACPKSATQRLCLKDKKGHALFDGSMLFFLFEGMKTMRPGFLDGLFAGRDLRAFLRNTFDDEPFQNTLREIQRFFLTEMASGNLSKNAGYHLLLENDDNARSFLDEPVFKTFWAKNGKDNAANVLNSLVESTMSIAEKKHAVQSLFSHWSESDKKDAWQNIHCRALWNRGLFASWFAVGTALGLSPSDFCELSADDIRRAVSFRTHKPSDWAKYVVFMKDTDLFSENEHLGFLKNLWRYACGDKDRSVSVQVFLYKLSEIEHECKALLNSGLAPKHFDFKEFEQIIKENVVQKNSLHYDVNRGDIIYNEGLAMIERAFLRDHLTSVARPEEKPLKPQRKM